MKSVLKRLTQRLRRVTRKVYAAAEETGMVLNHVAIDRSTPAEVCLELRRHSNCLSQLLGQLRQIGDKMA